MDSSPGNLDRPRRSAGSTVVEPFKQVKIGIWVMGISLLFLCVATFLIGLAFVRQYAHVMEIFSVVDPDVKWELITNDIFYRNAQMLGGAFIVYLLVLFFVVFRMTHKIYGPLVGIERFVDHIAEGDYSKRVVIRRGDELQRLTDRLNRMAAALEQKYGFPDRRRNSDSERVVQDNDRTG